MNRQASQKKCELELKDGHIMCPLGWWSFWEKIWEFPGCLNQKQTFRHVGRILDTRLGPRPVSDESLNIFVITVKLSCLRFVCFISHLWETVWSILLNLNVFSDWIWAYSLTVSFHFPILTRAHMDRSDEGDFRKNRSWHSSVHDDREVCRRIHRVFSRTVMTVSDMIWRVGLLLISYIQWT